MSTLVTTALRHNASASNNMVLDSSGRVGVGTPTPASPLDVVGAARVSGDLSFNSGFGSTAIAYGCRAWVNFNGTGVVAIRASGNVSSITDNGTGDYTVNFASAMTDANFCTVANGRFDEANTLGAANIGVCMARQTSGQTTSSSRVVSFATNSGSALDFLSVAVAIFR